MSLDWTQPVCEACWIEQEGEWDMSTDGTEVWQKLVALRIPARVVGEPTIERCSWCGAATFVGIYKREDPAKVRYPAEKEDENG